MITLSPRKMKDLRTHARWPRHLFVRHWLAAALVATSVAGAIIGLASSQPSDSGSQAQGPRPHDWFAPTTAGPIGMAARPPGEPALRSPNQLEKALLVHGSLRGVDLPPWGVANGQPLRPNRALRDRFDFYLLAIGEASLPELTELVRHHAEHALGSAIAHDVMDVWQRYLSLQQHRYSHAADPADIGSMQVALQEHRQARQQILGADWAQAFFGEEDARLAAEIDRALTGTALPRIDPDQALLSPAAGTSPEQVQQQRTERYGRDAAARLKAIDDAEAAWQQRIDAARGQIVAIQRDGQLSAHQRNQALSNVMDAAFPDPTEKLRASGLLGL